MRSFLLLILLATSFPSYAQPTENEKTFWTGGYIYGFTSTLCESKRLGYISEKEFYFLGKRIINFYRENMASFTYSNESTPYLYSLEDKNELNRVCSEVESQM